MSIFIFWMLKFIFRCSNYFLGVRIEFLDVLDIFIKKEIKLKSLF
jgi:hypothetical protein